MLQTRTTTDADLQDRIAGRLVAESDPDWDAVRQVFNLATDVRPAAIVLPEGVEDVVHAVEYARDHGLQVAAQSTGHNAAPLGPFDNLLLIDLRNLKSVTIDPYARRVRVGAGVRWQDVVPSLSELGLAALHGSSPLVGIAGYSLGGGMGWLARKYGLQTNSVRAFELVTADGRLVRADAEHEPDLFWALRGGNGNFGVVTAIEFEVYAVAQLYAGALFFPLEQARNVLETWTIAARSFPDELMTWTSLMQFPDEPDVPPPMRGQAYTVFHATFLGDEHGGAALLQPLRDLGPAIDTLAMVPPVMLADMAMDPTEPLPMMSTTALVSHLSETALDALLAAVGPGTGSPLPLIQIRQLGGELARRSPAAGARATIPGEFCVYALGVVVDEASTQRVATYLAALDAALAPYRVGEYPNFVETPADASRLFDADTWKGLRDVKALYDQGDLFRGNHHVPPTGLTSSDHPAEQLTGRVSQLGAV